MNAFHCLLCKLSRVGFIPSLLFILSACSAFMHGYTQANYEGLWWPVDETQAKITPSGMARLNLEMDFDNTIKAHVTINGYPDYIFIGSDELTELAYFETSTVHTFQRSFFGSTSELVGQTPISNAKADRLGNRPERHAMAVLGPQPSTEPTVIVSESLVARGAIRTPAQTLPAMTDNFGRYFALIIGNQNYRHISDLETPYVDTRAVAELLKKQYGFSVDVINDVTRYDIISTLSKYRRKLTDSDNLLIYYAGHGIIDRDTDKGYWLPVDAEEDNPANWISNDDIAGALKAMKAKHVLVVADSCYSGTLTRASLREYTTQRGSSEWVKRMAAKRSRTALTSGSLEPVNDGGGDGHSVFARAFLSVLTENKQTRDMDSLFDMIKRNVVLNASQTPSYADIRLSGHDGGDFIFSQK